MLESCFREFVLWATPHPRRRQAEGDGGQPFLLLPSARWSLAWGCASLGVLCLPSGQRRLETAEKVLASGASALPPGCSGSDGQLRGAGEGVCFLLRG